MKRIFNRTVLAFILAPAVASFSVAIIQATIRPPHDGPTWIDAFFQWLIPASLASYAISYTIGTVTFLILRFRKQESLKAYLIAGLVTGGLLGIVLLANGADGGLWLINTFAALAAGVSVTFAAIRGLSWR